MLLYWIIVHPVLCQTSSSADVFPLSIYYLFSYHRPLKIIGKKEENKHLEFRLKFCIWTEVPSQYCEGGSKLCGIFACVFETFCCRISIAKSLAGLLIGWAAFIQCQNLLSAWTALKNKPDKCFANIFITKPEIFNQSFIVIIFCLLHFLIQ